jgi:hypothetical protein
LSSVIIPLATGASVGAAGTARRRQKNLLCFLAPVPSWTWARCLKRSYAAARTSWGLHTWRSSTCSLSCASGRCSRTPLSLTTVLSWTWHDVERDVAQLLEPHEYSRRGGPIHVVCWAATLGRGSRPPSPRCLRGRRGGLGLHQNTTVGGGTEREWIRFWCSLIGYIFRTKA